MEAQDEEFEARIRALEGWRAEKAGEERRLSTVSAGAGGVVGGVVAVIVRVLGGAMLTRHINLSTGLINLSDKRSAIELLKILRDNRELYDPASLRAWALRHGWTPEGAEDLEKYAQAVLDRKSVHGDKYAWRSDIIETLRQRTL